MLLLFILIISKVKTANGFTYSINQEKNHRTFLQEGEVPMYNNSAEQFIRGFCVGKKNWVLIDTIAGANSSELQKSTLQSRRFE